ncbi:hypothetical protein ACUR5C_07235 [Aliikangiella sp. IMCC44653]
MTYKMFKINQDVEAVDIVTMADMSMDDYKRYLESDLLLVDTHDVLRSQPAGYPLATNAEQVDTLINYLNSIRSKVGSA